MNEDKITDFLQNCEVKGGESLICFMYSANSLSSNFRIFCKEKINQQIFGEIMLNIEKFVFEQKKQYFDRMNSIKRDLQDKEF